VGWRVQEYKDSAVDSNRNRGSPGTSLREAAIVDCGSDDIDLGAVSRCAGDVRVTSHERKPERFGKRDVDSVIGGEILAKLPYARQQEIVRIPYQREIEEVL
jgi:hypothetical protein